MKSKIAVLLLCVGTALTATSCSNMPFIQQDENGAQNLSDVVEKEQPKQPAPTDLDEPVEEATAESADSTEIKTMDESQGIRYEQYVNSNLGFAINYQTNWDVQEKENTITMKKDGMTVTVLISKITNDDYGLELLAKDAVNTLYDANAFVKYNETQFNTFRAIDIQYIIEENMRGEETLIVDSANKLAYILNINSTLDSYSKNKSVMQEIRDSFKLIKMETPTKETSEIEYEDTIVNDLDKKINMLQDMENQENNETTTQE